MQSFADYATTYQNMTNSQLLRAANDEGLVPEAQLALTVEMQRRNLKKSDIEEHKPSLNDRLQAEVRERSYRGTGILLYGRSYLSEIDREANIQLRTRFFCFAYLPLVPLGSYRFQADTQPRKWYQWRPPQQVIDRVPLNWNQIFTTWMKAVLCVAAVIGGFVLYFRYFDH